MICYNGVSEKQRVHVALFSEFLYADPFKDKCAVCSHYEKCAEKLKELNGYDRDNFHDIKQLVTPKHVVLLEKPDDHSIDNPTNALLGIAGNNEQKGLAVSSKEVGSRLIFTIKVLTDEQFVSNMRDSGLIIARYSQSYAQNKGGRAPAESGYSLDIPKRIPVVKAFITDDAVLDALVSREEARIRSAVDAFNASRAEPVLVTPFLSEALRVRK